MSTVQINTAFNVGLDFEIAPFHKRLLAYLIDFAILIAYQYSMKFLLFQEMRLSVEDSVVYFVLAISLPMLFYSLLTELLMNGQTLGKKLMRIRVISLEGGEPSFGQFVVRWISKFFELPFIFGYLFIIYPPVVYIFWTGFFGIAVIVAILVSAKSQRLGDMAAGTAVVDAKTFMSVHDTIFIDVKQDNYVLMFPEVMRLSDNDINTVKAVLTQARKTSNLDVCVRVEYKIKEVLGIQSDLHTFNFLSKLLEDYNYLATKE